MDKAYDIATDQDQLEVWLKSGMLDREALARLLDYLELESIRRRSQLAEDEANDAADEVDRAVWDAVKHKYTAG